MKKTPKTTQPSSLPIICRKFLAALLLAGGFLIWNSALGQSLGQLNYVTPYTFTTIAGTYGEVQNVDGTNGNAWFEQPQGVAVDTNDNLYVADIAANTIRKAVPVGTNWVVTTIAGDPENPGYNDGTNQAAEFDEPAAIAVDAAGNVYVADSYYSTIRELSLSGTNWVSSTIAGTPNPSGGSRNGTNGVAQFNGPSGMALDAAGRMYVADTYNDTIRQVVHVGTNWVVTTIAGTAGNQGPNDGTNGAAQFFDPVGIAVDNAGNLFVADSGNYTIRKITHVGTNWVVTTIAGTAGGQGVADGTNGAAQFDSPVVFAPMSLAVDASDNLYVTDGGNGVVRKVSPLGTNWVTTTLAGDPSRSDNIDGTGTNAVFGTPAGIAVDVAGKLFVGDIGNNDLREGIIAAVPNLAISVNASNGVVVSWPGSFGILQTNASLTAPNWVNYGGAVTNSNGTNSVTFTPSAATLFFRLTD
jgi:hypothetical protein